MNRSGFDPDLVRQFGDEEATVYPPASLFRDDFEPVRYLRALQTLPASPPLALRIEVPAAGMLDAPGGRRALRFAESLYREAALVGAFLPGGHRVSRVDLSGGATTALSKSQLATLCATLRERFSFMRGEGLDFSIALGSDPDPARMSGFVALGINAGALTIPDIDPAADLARRAQSVAATRIAIAAARREGIRRIDIEVGYGQPRQTPARLAATLANVVDLLPERVRLIRPRAGAGSAGQCRRVDHAEAESRLRLLELAVDLLRDAGYEYLGMDQFAHTSDPLTLARGNATLQRTDHGYTVHGSVMAIGLGVGAISGLGAVRTRNHDDLDRYCDALAKGRLPVARGIVCTSEDELRRDVVDALTCHLRVDKEAIAGRHGVDFDDHFAAELRSLTPMARAGLVAIDAPGLRVTRRGRYLTPAICRVFDAYQQAPAERLATALA